MKRDWLDLLPTPERLLDRVRRIALSGAVAGLFGGPEVLGGSALPKPTGSDQVTSVTATIVDRSRKVAKLVLQLPGRVSNLVAQHRSHSSHSSHRSHSSHVSGSGAVAAPAPRPPAAAPGPLTPEAPFPSTTIPLSLGSIAVAPSADAEQMTAKFFSFDYKQKILIVQDAVGAFFDFSVRDDSLITARGTTVRIDSYLNANFNNFPFSANQQVRISWKPSADGKKRVALAIQ